jgi:protein-tyrosine phosphatase
MTHIFKELYLGSAEDAFSDSFMLEKATSVLNVAKEIDMSPHCVNYLHIPLIDNDKERLAPHIDKAIEFINDSLEKNYRVLVHCAAGISRSASIVIAYLMFTCRKTFIDAYNEVKMKRPIINPNFAFSCQLYGYQETLQLE